MATPATGALDNAFELAKVADQALDFIAIQDHPYQAKFLDTWVLMAAVLCTRSPGLLTPIR